MDKALKIISNVILIAFIAVLVLYFALRFTGKAQIYRIETGSMETDVHAGDYVLVLDKKNYKIGDIVTYKKSKYYITHRIIKKKGDSVVTKGDANNTKDKATDVKNIVGKVIYHGGMLNILIDYKYIIASVLIALYLISCYINERKEKKTVPEREC